MGIDDRPSTEFKFSLISPCSGKSLDLNKLGFWMMQINELIPYAKCGVSKSTNSKSVS